MKSTTPLFAGCILLALRLVGDRREGRQLMTVKLYPKPT